MEASYTRLAHIMARLTIAAAFALPLIQVIVWLFWDTLAAQSPVAVTGLDVTALDLKGRIIGFSAGLAVSLVQAYGLLGLSKTFAEGARGDALSVRAITGFKRFAWTALALVPAKVITQTLNILLVSISDPQSPGQLSIQFGSGDLSAAFMAILLVFVAHVFTQGHAAQEENKAFI